MDIEYFFYVDDSTLQHLRPATRDERKWYHSLAQELGPYQKNIDRFQRVEDRFSALAEILEAPEKNAAKLERNAKRMLWQISCTLSTSVLIIGEPI